MADSDGLAAVLMQRLAERLDCAKMALYRYVPGKAELAALMLDRGLGQPPQHPDSDSGADSTVEPWCEALRDCAYTLHERYRTHPWARELTTGSRPLGPNELAWMEAMLAPLADTGLTGSERLDTVVFLNGHVRNLVQQTAVPGHEMTEDDLAPEVGAVLVAQTERFPHVAEFRYRAHLDGVSTLIARRRG
ncbi:TetR/AcrR family transcriptional regulator [Nocardia africana]|uniref:TetR/AcrR family transcriptional regulator n=1 Tax=Nocardia africana TaxID=134964 RepID=A0ABW6NCD8_9NOCA